MCQSAPRHPVYCYFVSEFVRAFRRKAILLLLLLLLLLQLSCHSVVHTLVQTKQIRINIHKRNNTKNRVHKIRNTVYTSTHITKTPTHYETQNSLRRPPSPSSFLQRVFVHIYSFPILSSCFFELVLSCKCRTTE